MNGNRKNQISVIIPVYNTGEMLYETASNILKQTYDLIELILVDDGSKKPTQAICDAIAKKDKRVKVIHKSNGGICSARNAGLKEATGDYVMFSDHDDEIAPNAVELALNAAQNYCVNVVKFRRTHKIISDAGIKEETLPYIEAQKITIRHWNDYMKIIRSSGYGIWTGLYKRSFLLNNQICFRENVKYGYEDHIFTSEVIRSAGEVYLFPDILYTWMQREQGSTSMISSNAALENRRDALLLWADIEKNIQEQLAASAEELYRRQHEYAQFFIHELKHSALSSAEKKAALHDFNQKVFRVQYAHDMQLSLKEKVKYFCIDHDMVEVFGIRK